MSNRPNYCRVDDCEAWTDHPSRYCLHHRYLAPRDEDDHPGGDSDDCDRGYWDNNEPEVELVDAWR